MFRLAVLLVVGALLTGCTEDKYTINLQIRDQDTMRTMQVTRVGGMKESSFDDEVAPARALYARTVESTAGRSIHLNGEFGVDTPDDMGNAGRISRIQSNLGQVIIYSERFRGTHDLVGLSERQQSACNTFVDVVVGWSKQEFAAKPGGPELVHAIDIDVRKDVQNLAMLGWFVSVMSTAGPHSDDPEAGNKLLTEYGARAMSLLIEHKYFAPEEPEPWKHFISIEGQATQESHLVLTAIARRLISEGKLESAQLLKATDTLTKSFLNFAWQHPEITKPWFEKYGPPCLKEVRNAEERDFELPLACEQLLLESVGVMAGPRDDLALSVEYEGECLSTNGIERKPGAIEWTFTTERGRNIGTTPPAVAMAVIASPDKKAQEGLLGSVRLKGRDLAAYSTAFAALTPAQQATWVALLQAHHSDADKLEAELEQTDIHYRLRPQLLLAVSSDGSTGE